MTTPTEIEFEATDPAPERRTPTPPRSWLLGRLSPGTAWLWARAKSPCPWGLGPHTREAGPHLAFGR